MVKAKGQEVNLLDLVPVRNMKWDKKDSGLIVLLKPKFTHPFFAKHILPRLKRPNYAIRLDEIGSYVWELFDGNLTVIELGERLKNKFGDKVEPLFDRLAVFLQSMEKNRFIYFKKPL